MESPKLDDFITSCAGPKNPEVGRVAWSDDTVWLDAAATKKVSRDAGTIGFRGVPEDVWNFHIGGYQVCEKWLKDRKGRTLSKDDIGHYQKIVVALAETIRLMKEIDEVIEKHGGWPGAFQVAADVEKSSEQVLKVAEDAPGIWRARGMSRPLLEMGSYPPGGYRRSLSSIWTAARLPAPPRYGSFASTRSRRKLLSVPLIKNTS